MSEFKLNELRTYAIKNRTSVTCRVSAADQTAVMEENGVMKIPGISGRPPYSADEVVARADQFTLAPKGQKPRTVSREEFAALLHPPKPAPAGKPAPESKPTAAGKKE